MIERRRLGASDLEAGRIALGCGSFGGLGSDPRFFGQGDSPDDAFRIMDAAWELGIDWFDTADAYGGGRSEQTIGSWMRETGRRPVVTTKTFNPMASGADSGLSRTRILRQIEGSLERLGLERADVYLAHDFDPDTPLAETLGAFEELVERGRIGAYGLSNFTADQIGVALEKGMPTLVQNSYSLLERGDEQDVIPLCAARGIAYQAYSPLAGGWLTGKYRRGARYPAGSRMTMRPDVYAHLDEDRVYSGLDALADAAAAREVSMGGLALAWALGHPDVAAIVVGPRRPDQLEAVREALSLELSPDERDELTSFFA